MYYVLYNKCFFVQVSVIQMDSANLHQNQLKYYDHKHGYSFVNHVAWLTQRGMISHNARLMDLSTTTAIHNDIQTYHIGIPVRSQDLASVQHKIYIIPQPPPPQQKNVLIHYPGKLLS